MINFRSLKLNASRYFSTSILPHTVNVFNNINISIPENVQISTFEAQFRASFQQFKRRQHSGIWLRIPRSSLSFMHILLENPYQFNLHHVVPENNSLVMTKWLNQGHSRLPPYTNHSAGAGGLVFNQEGAILMIQERYKFSEVPKWKLPGGLVDLRENILDAAERQIREQTGVKSKSIGILGFRQILNFRFGRTDLYFIVLCQALSSHIQIDPQQIAQAAWVPVSKVLDPNFQKFQTFKLVAQRMEKEMKNIQSPSALVQQLKRRLLTQRSVQSQYLSRKFKFFELSDP